MTSISSSASYSKCATIYSVSHKLSIIFFLSCCFIVLSCFSIFVFRCCCCCFSVQTNLLILILSHEMITARECARARAYLIHYASQWLTSFSLFISVEFWSCFLCMCVFVVVVFFKFCLWLILPISWRSNVSNIFFFSFCANPFNSNNKYTTY